MSLSGNGKVLVVLLIVFVVCDILLTPLGLETRPFADITTIGFATLAFLFFGLALNVASIFLIFRMPRNASTLAAVGSVFFFPALLADQSGNFSTMSAPARITGVEFVTAIVLIAAIFFALRVNRENPV